MCIYVHMFVYKKTQHGTVQQQHWSVESGKKNWLPQIQGIMKLLFPQLLFSNIPHTLLQ